MTTAGESLKIYKLRMAMQAHGTTKPSEAARKLTRLLVERLSQLDSAEQIEIPSNEYSATFKRLATGETLATLDLN